MLGREVVIREGVAACSIHDVFKETYVMKPPGYSPPSPKPVHETPFPIFVRGLFGFSSDVSGSGNPLTDLTLQVTEGHSVFEMKIQIQKKVDLQLEQFDLIFHNKRLDDDRTVRDYGLQSGSTIYLVLRLKGGEGELEVSADELAPEFDYDFTHVKDDGNQYMRGGFEYKRPCGWKRYAVRAVGRYENDDWLGPNGIRTSQASGEWPVSYHGTNKESAERIVEEGYEIGPGNAFGDGIYTSPSLEMVERDYAREFNCDGKRYKIALQNRVNPNGHLKIVDASINGSGADFWVSPNENDVRPYGILVREIEQPESRTDRDAKPMFSPVSTPRRILHPGLQTKPVSLTSVAQSGQPSLNNQTDSPCSLM